MIIEHKTYIEHFGIKGMRWGIRNKRDQPTGVSSRTSREARKDAQEFARAKLFFGEGAGTRRKLIKNTVESKAKRDPSYKKAFDHFLAKEDLGKHASGARKERRRKDIRKSTKQRAGFLARHLTGEQGTKAAFTAAAIAGVAYLSSPAGKRHMRKGMNALNNAQESFIRKQGARRLNKLFKNVDFANKTFR